MRKTNLLLLALTMLVPMSVFANRAEGVTFDFESTLEGFYNPLVETSAGLTLTVTPEGFSNGSVFVESRNPTLPILGRTKIIGSQLPDSEDYDSFAPLRFAFDHPVSEITFAFWDSGGDSDSPVTIEAYNAGNSLLETLTDTYPGGFESEKTISSSFSGASYFIVSSGGSAVNANSLYWEVPSVTIVPEPTAFALAVTLLFVGRRRARWHPHFG